MRAVFRLSAVAFAIGLGLATAHPAAAQINPFRGSLANRLTNDDFQAMSDAASSLLARDTLTIGATEAWQNPKTGTSGTIDVGRSFKHLSFGCYALNYTVYPGGAQGRSTSRAVLNWCKTSAGWKIVSLP
jgi:surface antigen